MTVDGRAEEFVLSWQDWHRRPGAGIGMPSDASSDLHQRPDTTRAFPDICSAAPKPGRTRFGNP
ncbi:hypothetical protein [Acrocarpospora catenulata]|uniref:hypothetical protein n=1 Tax=Acrocarpospora catenulata TaxID=2836182 RepID=UPI001BDAC500|nr:hypothetical protein [Acrocarpospora catenulata]